MAKSKVTFNYAVAIRSAGFHIVNDGGMNPHVQINFSNIDELLYDSIAAELNVIYNLAVYD
jgi:nucleosome binding factor SPN SPT16 subunit